MHIVKTSLILENDEKGIDVDFIKETHTDIGILGGGPAGYVAAIRAAQLGASVALIEEKEIGGTCLNRGCIPTKALLKTAEVLFLQSKARELGITSNVTSVDINAVISRKDRVVKSLRMGLEHLLEKNGVKVINGRGRIETSNQLTVNTPDGDISVKCGKLIITTGSEPLLPDIPGIKLENVITSDEALNLPAIPQSITIIGAGVIGMEFATFFNSLGSKVTVVELKNSILPGEDADVTEELGKIMKRQGVKFKLNSKITEIRETQNGLEVLVAGEENAILSETVLVAVGRKLNSFSPDIISLGVTISKGAIQVDRHMETGVSGVYAAGDVIGGKLLAHLAFAEGRVAAENAAGISSHLNYDAVPWCVYTNPEIAAVGMNEEQAKEKGLTVKTGRFDFRNNGRALCHAEREGFVKVITEADSGVILGARILGPHASELITELTLAVDQKIKAEVLADLIHPHPTLAEAVMEACGDAIGRAIHK
jgi:dihydrolipoamide dehydrogenase